MRERERCNARLSELLHLRLLTRETCEEKIDRNEPISAELRGEKQQRGGHHTVLPIRQLEK